MREEPIPTFDLYRELEVDRGASTETIDAAWRSLAKRFHPDTHDRVTGPRMARINTAHDWLSDPLRRARYDAETRPAAGSRTAAVSRASQSTPRARLQEPPGPSRVWPLQYAALCLAAVVVAYFASVTAIVLLNFANVSLFAVATLGTEVTATVLNLLGNLLFAGILGYLVAASWATVYQGGEADPAATFVGAIAALATTFGFPAFAASYLTALGEWLTGEGQGFPAIAVLSVIEAGVVGLAVSVTAALARARAQPGQAGG